MHNLLYFSSKFKSKCVSMKTITKFAIGLSLPLVMAFEYAVAEKKLKELDHLEVLKETSPIVLLAFNTLVKHESSYKHFNSDGQPKISKAGALGLTQVVPKDAISELSKSGYRFDLKKVKFHPPSNHSAGLVMYRDGGLKRRVLTQYCNELNLEALELAYGIYVAGGKNVYDAVKEYGADWSTAIGDGGDDDVSLGSKSRAYIRKII